MNYIDLQKLKSLYVNFEKDKILFNDGETSYSFYILVRGTIELIKDNNTILFIETPGEYIGVMSNLLDTPHYYTAKAYTDCTLIKITNDISEKLFFQSPEISLFIAKSLAKKLKEIINLVIELKDNNGIHDILNRHTLI